MKQHLLLLLLFTAVAGRMAAQPAQQYIRVLVAPQHEGWRYQCGEKAVFDVRVEKNNIPVKGADVTWELTRDMMPAFKTGSATLKDGKLTIDAGTLKEPGFIRCFVRTTGEGRTYEGVATAAYEPDRIEPTTTMPDDFDEFWEKAKSQNASVPMDPVMTLMPERCTGSVDVYHVSLQNYRPGARLYGILCLPKAPGKYSALLGVPGAGVHSINGDMGGAENGMITFEIGIHGIPLNMPAGYYRELGQGPLFDYPRIMLDDKDNYYYKRVYLGCVRAVDFISSLPQFDGQNICVRGGSQGGALAIVTAALDSRVKGLIAYFPALCDLGGYTYGRAGGWPHLFRYPDDPRTKERILTTRYYDVVNFARRLKVPGFYSMGYNDMVCPPTSMFSAYNVITAPKELFLVEETGHFSYTEQWTRAWEYLNKNLKLHP